MNVSILVFLGFLHFAIASPHVQAQEQPLRVDEEMVVKQHLIDVRVIDAHGRPVLGLGVEDFRLTHYGQTVPIRSCQWIDSAAPLDLPDPDAIEGQQALRVPGRLVVLFFQVELEAPRVSGMKRKIGQAMTVVAGLGERDYVAVLSFDSHLKLWTDFTRDVRQIQAALWKALRRQKPAYPTDGSFPSIAKHLDPVLSRRAANPEKGLFHLARALENIDGPKTLVYLGFGLGDYWRGNVELRRDYPAAMKALNASRTTVVGLDFSNWEYNTLNLGMRQFAEDTGGFFVKAPVFALQAIHKFENSNAGYYQISHDDPDNQGKKSPRYRLKLVGHRGRVLVKNPYR